MNRLTSQIVTAMLIAAMTLSGVVPVDARCAAKQPEPTSESRACCCSATGDGPMACCVPELATAACGCSARSSTPADPVRSTATAPQSKSEYRCVGVDAADGAGAADVSFGPPMSEVTPSLAVKSSRRQALLGCWQI